ncbi:hypothetical protein AB0K43_11450 [Kitasatospora sp. NPDC049258]|uniref:hypothetical protein n=1 Tax=Kitasatospora sp. NPDC049258 TaxID=3155394 RepID=UPI003413D9D9
MSMTGFPGWGSSVDRDGFDVLGFDPAPGSLPGVQTLVQDLHQAAKELEDARASVLRAADNGQAWQGRAADAFSARIARLPGQLDVAHASFSSAHRTLAAWHDQPAALKQKADDQEAQAKVAKRGRDRAADDPALDWAGRWFPDERHAEDATARMRAAQARLNTADAELEAITAQAEQLRVDHDRLAEQAARAVVAAGDQAPDGPDWFAELTNGVKDLAAFHLKLAGDAMAWVQEHANAIKAVGDALSNACSMMGIASLALAGAAAPTVEVPPLAAVLGTAAVATGVVSTGLSMAALGAHGVAKLGGADVPATAFGYRDPPLRVAHLPPSPASSRSRSRWSRRRVVSLIRWSS